MPKKPKVLKVGIIGVGGIAGSHFPGWEASPHAEVVALADISKDVVTRVGKDRGISKLYTDPMELIADKDIDIVDVCTPNMYHTAQTVAALKAGKHVLCEKPLAPTTDDIKKMIAARDKSGKTLMTAQHFRFQATAKALKAQIDKGVLGSVYHARSWMLRRALAPTRPGFYLKKNSGGGPCIDIGVHILDLTLWMLGNPRPVTVSGVSKDILAHKPGAFSKWGGAIPQDYDVEDFAAAFVRFETGATLVLEVSWLLHHKTEGEDMQMWLYGDEGGAHWPGNEITYADNNLQQLLSTQIGRVDGTEPHAQECIEFAQAIVEGAPSPVPAEQSMDVIAILDGLYRSSAAGKEIELDY